MLQPLRRLQVERLERGTPLLHIRELAEPNEVLRVVEIAVVPDREHAAPLLALDEMTLEECDELLASVRFQDVPSRFDDARVLQGSCFHLITISAGHSLEKSHFPASP